MKKKTTKQKFVNVPLDITDADFLTLAKEAHKQDITFNQLCINFLEEYMRKHSKENA